MIKDNELVSIVVPIYKVEKYLDRCVDSIVKQTYTTLQIILVEDGSPDGCSIICDKWVNRDDRIEVIHKKNTGLGLSRNEGLNTAKGKYVCFIDSDDYIHETTIEKLYSRIKETDSDVCYYGCVDVIDGMFSKKNPPEKVYYESREIRTHFAAKLIGNLPDEDNSNFTGMSACYAFYKTKFLNDNNIKFHSEKDKYISEDLIFNLTVCKFADKISILPESLYYYVIRRSDSLRSTYRADRFDKSKLMYDKLLEISNDFNLGDEGILRAQKYLLQATIVCVKMELMIKNNRRHMFQNLSKYANDKCIQEIMHEYPIKNLLWKQRIFALCIKFHWKYGIFVLAYLQNKKAKETV
ncbi:MAG: glycosyltransferase family 2 protein [Bacilli bacterium]